MAYVSPPDQVLPYIWMLKSVQAESIGTRNEDLGFLIGGALCVDSNGILVTLRHGIKPECPVFKDFDPSLSARPYSCQHFRNVKWIQSDVESGITFLKLAKNTDDETFPHIGIPNTVSLDMLRNLHAFAYDEGVPFTLLFARTSYPFNFYPTDDVRPRTMSDINLETYFTPGLNFISAYKKRRKWVHKGLLDGLSKLKSTLSLVEVNGFNPSTLDGQCGCPVFSTQDNTLVGLFAFSIGELQYIIPVQVLHQVLTNNWSSILERLRKGNEAMD